jgi:DNA-binding transcriptional LysR family regulator
MDLLAQMETFIRVVDVGSLSAAARARKLSLAAVSRQLVALESELGVVLVVRSTRRLQITEAGRLWYEHCVRVLRDVDEARAAISDKGVSGRLTVSAPVTLGLSQLLPKLNALTRQHPRLHIELRLEDHAADLIGEAVDVAVRGGLPPPDSTLFIAHPVLSFQRWLVASPAYLRRRGTPSDPAMLSRHDCLVQLGATAPLSTWHFLREGREHAVEVSGPISSTAPLALRELALSGVGIALLADWLVSDDVRHRRLIRLLAKWQSPPVSAWAIHRNQLRGAVRVRAFLAALRS